AKLLEHAKDLGDGLFQFLSNIFKGIPLEQFLPQKVEKKLKIPNCHSSTVTLSNCPTCYVPLEISKPF
nr:hypothetical protein [Candidatus Gracilibacteria bacterium]